MNIKSRTSEGLGDLTNCLSQYDFQIKYAPEKCIQCKMNTCIRVQLK